MVEIKTEDVDNIHFISVHGEIDAGSSIHLDNAFSAATENGHSKIAADLSGLTYISSAGLGVFVSYLDEFEQKEIKLVLFAVQEPVREVFDILGLEKIISILDSKEEAIRLLNE